jgi:hypothetical protein
VNSHEHRLRRRRAVGAAQEAFGSEEEAQEQGAKKTQLRAVLLNRCQLEFERFEAANPYKALDDAEKVRTTVAGVTAANVD